MTDRELGAGRAAVPGALPAHERAAATPLSSALVPALDAPDAEVAPAQAVACLTRCAERPLHHARVPAEDLGAALRRLAAGTRRPAC
jgi:hypothetical protein